MNIDRIFILLILLQAGASGVLAPHLPQLLLTSQAGPSFTAYPHTTTSIQQVLQHHVRQSSILQSTIQQVSRIVHFIN